MSPPSAATPQPPAGSSRWAVETYQSANAARGSAAAGGVGGGGGGDAPVGDRPRGLAGAGGGAPRRTLALGQRALHGLGDELVARAEVLVEAAVRQPGGAHDLGDARLLEARLADAG